MAIPYNRIEQCRQLGLSSRGRVMSNSTKEKLRLAILRDTKRMDMLRKGIRKNRAQSEETRKKISETMKRRGIKPVAPCRHTCHSPETRRKISLALGGNGTRVPKSFYSKQRRARKKLGGELKIGTIQLVYEDNIKMYGTLTCYLCLQPIEMGQDSLEHKMPLARGGTNEYYNLAVAHLSCNRKKNKKTEEEYREGLKNEQHIS